MVARTGVALGFLLSLLASGSGCSSPEHPPISPNDDPGNALGDGGRARDKPLASEAGAMDAAPDPAKCGADVPEPEPDVVEVSAPPPEPAFDGGTLVEGTYRVVTRVIYRLNATVEGPAGLRTVFRGPRYTSVLTRPKAPTLYFGGTWSTKGNVVSYKPDCPVTGAGTDFAYNADGKTYQTNIGNSEVYTFVRE